MDRNSFSSKTNNTKLKLKHFPKLTLEMIKTIWISYSSYQNCIKKLFRRITNLYLERLEQFSKLFKTAFNFESC